MSINKAKLVLSTLLVLLLIGISFSAFPDNNTLVIYFCDVGQGDATYIRFPDGQDMLIDGGPGYKILDCLGKAMPFYDRHINVVVLTHPQQDHMFGLIPVIERYSVDYLVSSPAGNTSQTYQKFKDLVDAKNITVKNLYAGSSIQFDKVSFTIFWPDRRWAYSHLSCDGALCSDLAMETNVLGVESTSSDLNDYSVMGLLYYKTFEAVFTGDGDSRIQDDIERIGLIDLPLEDVEVLKVPHHGSKTAMTDWFFNTFKGKLAVIMVGKDNRYGHPNQEVVNKFKDAGSEVMQTDIEGIIKVETDGNTWYAKPL